MTGDKLLIRHFGLRPWEINSLTLSERWLYFQVLQDMAKEQNGENDHSLLPHFAELAEM